MSPRWDDDARSAERQQILHTFSDISTASVPLMNVSWRIFVYNKKILVFDFLELSRCVVYSVFWSSFQATAAEHQRRLGLQPQPSQVECELKFVYRFNQIIRNSRFSVLGQIRSENIAFDVFCFLGHRPEKDRMKFVKWKFFGMIQTKCQCYLSVP